jgi:hypothetical protein
MEGRYDRSRLALFVAPKKTLLFSTTKIILLTIKEIITVHCENLRNPKNALCGKNTVTEY